METLFLFMQQEYSLYIMDMPSFSAEEKSMLFPKEFDLLYYLAGQPRQVFRCKQMYCYVWNEAALTGNDETVKDHIKLLCKKLAAMEKHYIQNICNL